ncbi:cytochrome P450 family protein [Rhizoctonia solani AG-3 Rhs1AP]|uniref:Cytochrome P450 family protein n=1 Tax=Rhizoctonia solani AG-3 Rhs1AP TaxID=1086054 RepID=X8IWH2_9AGAM|nr:cytochrome P450 family protein [Rhizoctonia solani AG-3 Rhs1AP]
MLSALASLYVVSLPLALIFLYRYWRSIQQLKVRTPPSPLSLPFVGNLFSIPSGSEHYAFAKLGEQLKSDIIFLNILGHKLVILNSAEAASEILDKRSMLYSDRPQIPMVANPTLMNWPGLPSIVGYNDLWRHYRRMMNNWLNARAVTQFASLQEQQARLLLRQLLGITNHSRPFKHIKNEFFFAMGSLMFQLAYGYKPRDSQDQFFQEAKLAFHNVMSAAMQTNFFVNTFPALLYVPDWFPGTRWKRAGREYGLQQDTAKTGPYEWVKAQVASGTQQHSLLGSLLQGHELVSGLSLAERDRRLKEIGITLFGGGMDTSAHFLVSFVASMVLNPHVQARAQQELDTVLGRAVLPSISDKERLPYVRNVINEVFRLYPVAPLAMAHMCYQDDIYRGYSIQKGTLVLGNIWAMGRDPRHYENPEEFYPDRYLDPAVPRPPVFGWGRRKCPGVYFADASVFINAASILATFTFTKKRDENGREMMPQIEMERNSIMFELKPFEFELKPRSEEHRQLILGANAEG